MRESKITVSTTTTASLEDAWACQDAPRDMQQAGWQAILDRFAAVAARSQP